MSPITQTRWLRIAAIFPSTAMAFMDQSILPVALPIIQGEFGAGNSSLQWTVNSYILGMAVFVLIGGKLADRIGHRKAYLLGMFLFAFFSALCSLSPDIGFLIAARGLQGVGAAIMFPAQTSLIATSFPPHSRGQATGIIVSIGSIFAVLGPMIGGILTEHLSWRWIFWINLPITLIGILLSLALLPATEGRRSKVDLPGFLYFTGFAFFITVFFMQIVDWGWSSVNTLACGFLFLLAFWFLIRREKKAEHPFLEMTLFKRPVFSAICLSIAITQFILMIGVYRTIYTEEILGYTPSEAGFISSISSLPILFFSYIGGFLADKITPKLPIALGYLLIVLSFFWLGFHPTPSLPIYFIALLSFGMGVPLIFTPSYTMAMADIPSAKFGTAFGLIATLRMFAGTMGLSLIYLFSSTSQKHYLPKQGPRLAEISTFSLVHYVLGVLMLAVFFLAIFIYRKKKAAHHLPEAPAEGWD